MNRDNEEIPEVEYKVRLLEAYEMLDVNPWGFMLYGVLRTESQGS